VTGAGDVLGGVNEGANEMRTDYDSGLSDCQKRTRLGPPRSLLTVFATYICRSRAMYSLYSRERFVPGTA
jgi:hypothetical protein